MKKLIPLLLCTALLGLLSTGCQTTAPDPLTTVIQIDTPGGAKAYVSSPKDTELQSLMFSPSTGEILVEGFSTSATDPTAAYMGIIAEQGKIQAEQSRQMTELLGILGRSLGGGAPASE
ncbi:MAG: hypothetical protein EA353_03760 [Puniceicoccaceae bacterium]|nr:MAG: hypothetical protein EA353_03760 [Puniceicoccaceae bacterium]